MISPSAIPQFTGDLATLETAVTNLGKDAGAIRKTGADVHSQFQGLSAYYTAPEAEQLFATTKPVADRADAFGDDLEKVGKALSEYAAEVKPIAEKLKQLKLDAAAFVESVKDDDEWKYDGDKIEKHNGIQADVTAAVAAFWAAERACANKITALFGGTQFVANDGSNKENMYGYSADDLKNAKVPWGTPEEESHHWYEVGHWVKSFVWDGLIVDGIWGTIKGLGTLVGFQGLDAMGQAWKGLAQLATGLLVMSVPVVGAAYMMAPDDKLPSWLRDSRTAVKETGKALVAWDEWGKNPARAAGAVTFNVVTTVFTGGAGAGVSGAGKAGAVAKTLSALSKTGKAIDPMTYITKAGGAGLSKLGDVMAGLKGVGNIDIPPLPASTFQLPEGALKLPDGTFEIPPGATVPDGAVKVSDTTFKLPEGAVTVPEGTVKLPTEAGVPAQYMDPKGNILDGRGSVIQHADDAPRGLDLDARPAELPRIETPVREPALVGAVPNTADNVAHVGDDLGDTGRVGSDVTGPTGQAGDSLPGGGADELGRGPSASHETPTGGGHTDGPGGGDHTPAGDHTPGSGGDHTPAGLGDDQLPSDPGGELPPPPHGGGPDLPGSAVPDGPQGNLPDGSWVGENGLRLDPEANAAADDFMRRSAEAEPRITESMQSIAGDVDGGRLLGLEYRLKGEDSLKRKLATDMLEDIGVRPGQALGDIKDSVRYTMEVPAGNYTHGVQQAVDQLQARGFENVTFKNTWDSAGYKGINSTWRDPVSGTTFEMQFHTADSFKAKMDGHVLYEKERLPGVSKDELAAIRAEQADLFGKVPVPRDAGAIRLGGHGLDDVASGLGREPGSVADDLGRTVDDVSDVGDDAARAGDDAAQAGDDAAGQADEAAEAPRGDEGPYTRGPDGGWSGAGWVTDPPSAYSAGVYESLRATPNHIDVPVMSRNTGVHESVIREVKTHMIRAQHDVVVGPGDVRHGRFTPRDDIADLWDGARKGTLTPEQKLEFKHLMTHEYVESRLMKGGLPYLKDHSGSWWRNPDGTPAGHKSPKSLSAAGAHDLAPNPARGGFGTAWQKLGLKHPRTPLADDLSNIDDFVNDIVKELRAKGLNIK